jgi:hypothetical protein
MTPGKKKDLIEEEKCEKFLPCQLTEQEILVTARDLAHLNQDLSATEDRKKNVMADIQAQIKKLEAEINIDARKISTGEEHRQVKCIWERNFTGGLARLIRQDTQEVLDQKEISQKERQDKLDLV